MASSYTYPVARPTGTLTTAQLHLLLANPRVIAKRIGQLTDQRFISDYLLGGRYTADGGGIFYETGEQIFAADSAEAVEPLAEYPLTVLSSGDLAAAKTTKWGLATEFSDEKISREGQSYVDRGLVRLANQVIKNVDAVTMGVIGSKITDTFASQAWTSIANVIQAVLAAQAARQDLALGIDAETIALSGAQWAKVMGLFASAGVLPREDGNPIVSGQYPQNLLGFTWVTSPWIVGSDPLLIDRDQLGGMADEKLQSPGYVTAGATGVETNTTRLSDGVDGYRSQARRVTVPVVIEPHAGVRITGTGL